MMFYLHPNHTTTASENPNSLYVCEDMKAAQGQTTQLAPFCCRVGGQIQNDKEALPISESKPVSFIERSI